LNDPVVLEMIGPVEAKNNWRAVENAYKEKFPERKVLYSRFDKGKGHIAISSHKQEVAKLSEEVKLKLGDEEFVIKKMDQEGLDKFWKEHGDHFNMCTNKKLSLSSILIICLIKN